MHKAVLLNEVLTHLNPHPDQNFIDATYGFGGHSGALLKMNGPQGKILGIEADPVVYQHALSGEREPRLILVNDSFTHIRKIAREKKLHPVNGILFDLGFSSWHVEHSGRGFSFHKDEPLDMRYNPRLQKTSAAELVNRLSEEDLFELFRTYGEERFARKIARAIRETRRERRILTSGHLSDVLVGISRGRSSRLHPATKVFQALRIAVNRELEDIETALPEAFDALDYGGRLVVISFHSLEDRIVKKFFREMRNEKKAEILTKKPVRPTREEIRENPRSRSARLRAIIKKE